MASPAQQTNTAASNEKVAVSWNPYPFAIGYRVYRSASPSAGFMRVTGTSHAASYTGKTTDTFTSAAGFDYALWSGLNPTAVVNLSVTSGGAEQGYAYSSFGYPCKAVGIVTNSASAAAPPPPATGR